MCQVFTFFLSTGSGVVKASVSSDGHFLVVLDDKVRVPVIIWDFKNALIR